MSSKPTSLPLLAGGATPCVIPKTINLIVAPEQVLHFNGGLHTADKHGIIADVPWDVAVVMINDQAHPARLASDQEMAAAGYIPLSAGPRRRPVTLSRLAPMNSVFCARPPLRPTPSSPPCPPNSARPRSSIPARVSGPHEDMIFAVEKGGAEIARGTVTELFAVVPAAPDLTLLDETATDETDGEHDGDDLPETSTAAE